MENSCSSSDSHQFDKTKCWSLFYIDEDDNVMHDFGWRDDDDVVTLAQLLMAIKYTQIIMQSLQSAYLEYIENNPDDASKISEIIQTIELSTEVNPGNKDYISPLFNSFGDIDE